MNTQGQGGRVYDRATQDAIDDYHRVKSSIGDLHEATRLAPSFLPEDATIEEIRKATRVLEDLTGGAVVRFLGRTK